MQFDFWYPFSTIFNLFGAMFLIIPIMFIVIFIIIGVTICRAGSRAVGNVARSFTTEAPLFVIPERQRRQMRSDGSQMTTVRLPERCPSCGAAVSHEGIDWVGPLEAKCNYCGSVLRATFEAV